MSFEKILVAIDGSDCSDHAFATALELAALANARLTALAVEARCRRTPRRSERSTR